MAEFSIKVTDHSPEVLAALQERAEAALEAIGNQAVSHAKQNITKAGRVDTGALRNSMSHTVVESEKAVIVGTNIEYAIFHEYGTGIYADDGRGRKTPWSYQDAKGNWHRTRGMAAIHFLKNAVQNHKEEYQRIIKQFLKNS